MGVLIGTLQAIHGIPHCDANVPVTTQYAVTNETKLSSPHAVLLVGIAQRMLATSIWVKFFSHSPELDSNHLPPKTGFKGPHDALYQ